MMNILWYVFYILLQADSACRNVHNLVHCGTSKKICSARNIIFLNDSPFLKWSVHCPFFGRPGRHPSSSGHAPHGTRSCICMYFVRMLIFTIVSVIVLAIVCMIARAIFLVGPGFKPLALQHDLFCGSRVRTPALAA